MTTLTIYMKSGNKIKLRHIGNWEAEIQGNTVTSLSISRTPWLDWLRKEKLVVGSIDLSQIEAITKT